MSISSVNNQGMIIQPTSLDTDDNTNELGQEEFLNILMTQLQYQDPLEPMNDTDFIAQLAQFSALEQMQMTNQGITYSNAFSIMGKVVETNGIDEITGNQTIDQGIVESVTIQDGQVFLSVNGKEIDMESIVRVIEPSALEE